MGIPLPPAGIDAALLPFAGIAIAMVAITVFVLGKVLPRDGQAPLITQMLLALTVLGGGSLLLLALLFVFLNPDGTSAWTWVLLAFNFMMMFPAGLWFVSLIVFQDRRISASAPVWPLTFGLVITGSEAIMGVLFALAGAGHGLPASRALATGLSSVWFFWSMAAVTAALVAWAPLTAAERSGAGALAVAAVFGPWVTAFPIAGGLAMVALMAVVFVGLTRLLARRPATSGELGFLLGLDAVFLAMTLVGLWIVLAPGNYEAAIAFGGVMGLGMVGEVTYLVRRFYVGPPARAWWARAPDRDELPVRGAGARGAADVGPSAR